MLACAAGLALACGRGPAASESSPTGTTGLTRARLDEPRAASPAPAEIARPGLVDVQVEGEPTSYAVLATTGASPRIVYLHGMCSTSRETLESFAATAQELGGVLALTGDKACEDGTHSFTVDAELQQRRIDEALKIADGALRPPEVVIGYSQGAVLAEKLAVTKGYPFVILIGSPRTPSPANLRKARAVVMISGELDMAKPKMKAARAACEEAGIPARYLEMPGAKHGELPDAEAVIGEALRWMEANARPAPSSGGGP